MLFVVSSFTVTFITTLNCQIKYKDLKCQNKLEKLTNSHMVVCSDFISNFSVIEYFVTRVAR